MVSIGIIAYRGEQDYATPYAESILRYERDTEIVLVDSASDPPYPADDQWKVVRVNYPECERFNYARCCNIALDNMTGDWLAISNDDGMCLGKYKHSIEGLNKKAVYGTDIFANKAIVAGKTIFHADGWFLLFHRSVYEKVGRFDENIPQWGVDADFCYRADKLGFASREIDIPFIHLKSERRRSVDGWHMAGQKAMVYIRGKIGRKR